MNTVMGLLSHTIYEVEHHVEELQLKVVEAKTRCDRLTLDIDKQKCDIQTLTDEFTYVLKGLGDLRDLYITMKEHLQTLLDKTPEADPQVGP